MRAFWIAFVAIENQIEIKSSIVKSGYVESGRCDEMRCGLNAPPWCEAMRMLER